MIITIPFPKPCCSLIMSGISNSVHEINMIDRCRSSRRTYFMTSHLPDFLSQFGIDYSIDGPQLEYFVYQKKTNPDISCSLTFKYDNAIRQINVMTLYPGLWLHPGTRYLSAVCFFMVIQHVANFYHIESVCRISLNTEKNVFDNFYSLLKDVDFYITVIRQRRTGIYRKPLFSHTN